MNELVLRNRQRTRPVNVRLLRRLALALIADHLQLRRFALGIYLVDGRKITHLNEQYLNHGGATDIITFDYADAYQPGEAFGDLFICVDVAMEQARTFGTTWTDELARYVVHGLLHLQGFDDREPVARRRMKAEENRLFKEMAAEFPLAQLARPRRSRTP